MAIASLDEDAGGIQSAGSRKRSRDPMSEFSVGRFRCLAGR
jgi:hypothetical protein